MSDIKDVEIMPQYWQPHDAVRQFSIGADDVIQYPAGPDDAARWVAWLGSDTRFRSVGIVGHSEGALVGTIAA